MAQKFQEGDRVYWHDSSYRECYGIFISHEINHAVVFESGFTRKVPMENLRHSLVKTPNEWNSWKA